MKSFKRFISEKSDKESISKNKNKSASRFWGTTSLSDIYKEDTPGQCNEELIVERGADSKGHFLPTEKGAGMTRKGVMAYRRKNPGSKLKTAVTGKVKPGSKDAKRRKSFCARMSGMKGPMKDEKGRPTRKAMSLRRWRCRS